MTGSAEEQAQREIEENDTYWEDQLGIAILIAVEAHDGQLDKAGKPYILHPIRVMMQMDRNNPQLQILAVLHDVLEDSDVTVPEMVKEGMNDYLLNTLQDDLTHTSDRTYMQYIRNLADNEWARTIKLADLRDNMDMERLREITQRDLKRLEKYHAALRYLLEWQRNEELV